MSKESWREMISQAISENKDGPLIACSITEEELNVKFNTGWGGSGGTPFTAWTEKRVYFPVVYDGAEWVGSAPRNPSLEHTPHVGGQ